MRTLSSLGRFIFAAQIAVTGHAQPSQSDERSVRDLIKVFANARNAHDGEAASRLYSDDGEWISATGGTMRGRSQLVQLWSGVTGQVERTIQSVEFPGSNIGVVRVMTQYEEPIGRHNEVFIVVKDEGKWRIRVHQTLD